MQCSQPSARNFPPEAPKLPSGSAIITTKSLFFKKKKFTLFAGQLNGVSATPSKLFDKNSKSQKMKFFQKQSFSQITPLGLFVPFWQNRQHFTQKIELRSLEAREKTRNYLFFKNKCVTCKYFSGYVESSFGKLFPPINTFLPDIPKSINGNPRNFKKAHFVPKNFLKKRFSAQKRSLDT